MRPIWAQAATGALTFVVVAGLAFLPAQLLNPGSTGPQGTVGVPATTSAHPVELIAAPAPSRHAIAERVARPERAPVARHTVAVAAAAAFDHAAPAVRPTHRAQGPPTRSAAAPAAAPAPPPAPGPAPAPAPAAPAPATPTSAPAPTSTPAGLLTDSHPASRPEKASHAEKNAAKTPAHPAHRRKPSPAPEAVPAIAPAPAAPAQPAPAQVGHGQGQGHDEGTPPGHDPGAPPGQGSSHDDGHGHGH